MSHSFKIPTARKTRVMKEIDGWKFVTHHGSQSTDCDLILTSYNVDVKRYEVRDMAEALDILNRFLDRHPAGCRCADCLD